MVILRKALLALTIFLGAFLVFGIQPMVGKTILPVFGGAASVWSICLAAFQIMLVGGYFYAHRLAHSKPKYILLHLMMLGAASVWTGFASLHLNVLTNWTNIITYPGVGALGVVCMLVGAPYILLSANSSLVQVMSGGEYRLYAISNAGSLCGLLVYPLGVEPYFTLTHQWIGFSVGIMIYVIMIAVLIVLSRFGELRLCNDKPSLETSETSSEVSTEGKSAWKEWLSLSAASCFLLNGVSAHLINDVTPLPLMWAVLLALYLVSYITAFTNRGAMFAKWLGMPVTVLSIVAAYYAGKETGESFAEQLSIGCALIFFGGWLIHGRIYRLRPNAERLTSYYLAIAVGGALGGMSASLLIPAAFPFVAEYPASLAILPAIALLDMSHPLKEKLGLAIDWRWCAAGCFALAVYGCARSMSAEGMVLERCRNFHGVSRVVLDRFKVSDGSSFQAHIFQNNATVHGYQLIDGTWKSRLPTTYYTDHTGGRAILVHPAYSTNKPMRVALAGMGIGVLASYCRKNDFYRFYEINSQVAELATNKVLFSFISGAPGEIEVIIDDARKALEREREQNEDKYDVLIVDVFSGDSIPAHMATKEAVQLYLDRLKPDGILAFHISNWHLNLSPFVKAAAKEFDLYYEDLQCIDDKYTFMAHWAYLSRQKFDFKIPGKHGIVKAEDVKTIPLMTDQLHSLLPYIGRQKEVPLIPAPPSKKGSGSLF